VAVVVAELSNDEANDLADEILLRSEFLPAREPGFFGRTVDRVIEEIGDLLGRIFGAIFGGSGGSAGNVLAVILLAVAAVVLILAIYKAITSRVPKMAEEDGDGTRIVFDEIVEPEALLAELTRHRAAGEWRVAAVAGFRLGVVGLIDQNIAREVAGATTGDFATAVSRRRPELLEFYMPASAAFERAVYSDLAVGQEDVEAIDRLLASLSMVGAGA
jgi:hypothetical protein